eukprot:TRINITY_DN10134_c0_g1_i1.p1 TRINITY_DN10134_c0_g1~~TRINITY_DN10134_c0_g1_i1.p1  ORF type:complete len:371 (-),score=24.13 TRINITY_DN10134_c0_g1_i1:79-1116(-)
MYPFVNEFLHHPEATSCSWSPDGSRIVTACRMNLIKFWDGTTYSLQKTLDLAVVSIDYGFHDVICSWSPSGSLVALIFYSRILILNPNDYSILSSLTSHFDRILSIDWSRDGTKFLTSSQDTTIKVWGGSKFSRLLKTIEAVPPKFDQPVKSLDYKFKYPGPLPVTCCRYSPDGSRIVSSSGSEIMVWDSTTYVQIMRFFGQGNRVNSLCWSPDGSRFLSCSQDGSTTVWDGKTFKRQKQFFREHGGQVDWCSWSPGGSLILSTGPDGIVQVRKADSFEIVNRFHTHQNKTLNQCHWSPCGTYIVHVSKDMTIKLWKFNDNVAGETNETEVPGSIQLQVAEILTG